ncbi:CDP-diacylglycerol--serine O-phosphatidyltransferase 1 isoform X2 [Cryptomeria japonica]|uniref:CDP-diacylglycerol--serine O-phosphatidyltransferase 1 isoform X2 n=1 Tax=Cryptomeria japonica TaxID=3369 RepID=UPI0027DA3FDC|nr:CDP-diacylglycerol--serine O-phosphatidyltransferase 1 isoform X2 [Cryptomeria japonica]XP_057841328.2 CDP-diacylglycerol--serine O-phosphatidyltransferase 1 isoform X2 [Cryptomeria japonica]
MDMQHKATMSMVSKAQTTEQNDDTKLCSSIEELDPWTAWAYRPHTISLLLVGAGLLIWACGALDPAKTVDTDRVTSVKRGVWAMVAVFLGYCLLQAPSTILIRPHPAIWRLVHGIAVIYLVSLTFLLFQNRDDARQFMKFVHPDLGVELPERSYGTDCRIYTPENPKRRFNNVYETLFDEFVIAHVLGWWGKAIMFRNQPLLWLLSIGFEMMEVTFNHMLPNFNECWWDSIILDIFICNWFGIWAGMKTVRYFDGKTYEWVGISRQRSIMGKVKRTLGQFTPANWDKDEWQPLSGPWRFFQVFGLIIVFLTVELNAFFLKFCLWIPPRNPLNAYRLIIWWLIAVPTIREYNSYLQDRYSFHLCSSTNIAKGIDNPGVYASLDRHFVSVELHWLWQKINKEGGDVLLALSCHLYCGAINLH